MKFSDLNIGDTFLFGDYSSFIHGLKPTSLDGVRYRKTSDNTITAFKDNKPFQFTLNNDVVDESVKFVGQNFENGERIEITLSNEPNSEKRYEFVSRDGRVIDDRKVTIEDIINAGFGNYFDYADSLVLFSDQDPSLIVDFAQPVKRTGSDLLELSLHRLNPEATSTIKYQRLENGDFHFSILANDKPTSELMPLGAEISLKFFLENENLFANTKTLREHEQDYIAVKRERDMESKDTEKESPCLG